MSLINKGCEMHWRDTAVRRIVYRWYYSIERKFILVFSVMLSCAIFYMAPEIDNTPYNVVLLVCFVSTPILLCLGTFSVVKDIPDVYIDGGKHVPWYVISKILSSSKVGENIKEKILERRPWKYPISFRTLFDIEDKCIDDLKSSAGASDGYSDRS